MKDIDEILKEIVLKTVEKENPKAIPDDYQKMRRQCLKINFWDNRKNPDPLAPGYRADSFELFIMLPFWIKAKGRSLYLYNPKQNINDDVFGYKTSDILDALHKLTSKMPSYTTGISHNDYWGQITLNLLYYDMQGNRLPDDYWKSDPHNWGPMSNPPIFSKDNYIPVCVPLYFKDGEDFREYMTGTEFSYYLKKR